MQALANIEGVHILTNKLGSNSSRPGQHFLADRIRSSTSGKFITNVVGTMQCALMFLAGSAGPSSEATLHPPCHRIGSLMESIRSSGSPLAFVFSCPCLWSCNGTSVSDCGQDQRDRNNQPQQEDNAQGPRNFDLPIGVKPRPLTSFLAIFHAVLSSATQDAIRLPSKITRLGASAFDINLQHRAFPFDKGDKQYPYSRSSA